MNAAVLVVDNYDSFTYNLVHELRCLVADVRVLRNDVLDIAAIAASPPAAVVISPGPGTPQRAGGCLELIRALRGRTAIFGVCLGHQAIGVAYGASVKQACEPVHGRATLVTHEPHRLFTGIPTRFRAGRYHSLEIDNRTLPNVLVPIAHGDDGMLMALADRHEPVFGVQFHPESVLTHYGPRLLANFIAIAGATA